MLQPPHQSDVQPLCKRDRCVLCAANSRASARGRPIMTPPSAIASKNIQANAGPEPESAVHASKCFSSRNRHRPMEENMLRIICRSRSTVDDSGIEFTTVMPSLICSARRSAFLGGRPAPKHITYSTRSVGHCTDDPSTRVYHGSKLLDGNTGQNADEQFPF